MEKTVNQRIKSIFLQSGERSIRSYALSIGVAPTTLNECIKGSEPRFSLIKSILDGNPSISAEWLLLGQGSMYKSENTTQEPSQAEERIDTKSTLNVLIKTIEYYQKEVDRIMDNINELRKENEILKIELERKKAVGE